jgi:hypothetical protein
MPGSMMQGVRLVSKEKHDLAGRGKKVTFYF